MRAVVTLALTFALVVDAGKFVRDVRVGPEGSDEPDLESGLTRSLPSVKVTSHDSADDFGPYISNVGESGASVSRDFGSASVSRDFGSASASHGFGRAHELDFGADLQDHRDSGAETVSHLGEMQDFDEEETFRGEVLSAQPEPRSPRVNSGYMQPVATQNGVPSPTMLVDPVGSVLPSPTERLASSTESAASSTETPTMSTLPSPTEHAPGMTASSGLPPMTHREGPSAVGPGEVATVDVEPVRDLDLDRVQAIGCGVDQATSLPNYIKMRRAEDSGKYTFQLATDYPHEWQDMHINVGSVMFHCDDGYTLDGNYPAHNNRIAQAQCGNRGWDYFPVSFNPDQPSQLQGIDTENPLPHIECKPTKCTPTPPAHNADVFYFEVGGSFGAGGQRHGRPVRAAKKGVDQNLRHGDVVQYRAHESFSVDGVSGEAVTVELECFRGLWFDVKYIDSANSGRPGDASFTPYVKPPALRVQAEGDGRVEEVVMAPLSCHPGKDTPAFQGDHVDLDSIGTGTLVGRSLTVVCLSGYWFDPLTRQQPSRVVTCEFSEEFGMPMFVDEVGTSCAPATCQVDESFGELVVEGSLTIGASGGLSSVRELADELGGTVSIAFGEAVTATCVPGAALFGERAGQSTLKAVCNENGRLTPNGVCRMKSCQHDVIDEAGLVGERIEREHTKQHVIECPEGMVHADTADFVGRQELASGGTNYRTIFECDASNVEDAWHCTEGCSSADPLTRVPDCKPILCEVPTVFDHEGAELSNAVLPEVEVGIAFGRSGTVRCPHGYLIFEQETFELGACGDDAQFEHVAGLAPGARLVCEPVGDFCKEITSEFAGLTEWAAERHLTVVEPAEGVATVIDSTFTVKCEDGHEFSSALDLGSHSTTQTVTVTCSEDEHHKGIYTWSYNGVPQRTVQDLECEPVLCDVPAAINGATATTRNAVGINDAVEFACDEHHVLVGVNGDVGRAGGSFMATCGADGHFFYEDHDGGKDITASFPRCILSCGDPLAALGELSAALAWTGQSTLHCGDHCEAHGLPADGSEWGEIVCKSKHTITPQPHPVVQGLKLTCDGAWRVGDEPLAEQGLHLLSQCGRHLRVVREHIEATASGFQETVVQSEMCLSLDAEGDRVELRACADADPRQYFFFTTEGYDAEQDVDRAEGQIVSAVTTPHGGHKCLASAVQETPAGVIKKLSPIQAAVEPCREAKHDDHRSYAAGANNGRLSTSWSDTEQQFGYQKIRGDAGNVEYDMWMLRRDLAQAPTEHQRDVLKRGFMYIPYAPMTIKLEGLPVVANPTLHTHQYVFCYGRHCAEAAVEPELALAQAF